jgi:hypothetical protein
MIQENKITRSNVNRLVKETAETFTPEFFDDSSKCWQKNKKKLLNGTYKYTCNHIYKTSGKICGRSGEHSHK